MAGKGSKLRKGANLQKYWDNYPFPEKLTVSQWKNKLGYSNIDDFNFKDVPVGSKITEQDFLKRVVEILPLTEEELNDFKDDMDSMSFSEFKKITNK